MVVLIYVNGADWELGRGHRARCEALEDALEALGAEPRMTHLGGYGWDVALDEGGNAVLPNGTVLDGLEFQMLRPEFAQNRPPAPRTDPEGVAVVCYPSTLALEMICLGYRVALLPPRNEGERALAIKLVACPDPFAVVDGRGAVRVAQRVIATLTAAPPPGSADATPRSSPRDPPG